MNDELISRQEAKDKLFDEVFDVISDDDWTDEIGTICDKVCKVLESLPSAQLPQGEWILCEEQNHVELMYYCSECGFIAWGENEKTNYCPNCGSYNGGGKNEA